MTAPRPPIAPAASISRCANGPRSWILPAAATVALVGLCASPAWSKPQVPFCAGLKAAVADAKTGFATLRGAKLSYTGDDGGGDDETRYATPPLAGAAGCNVDLDRSDYEDVLPTYVCWFDPTSSRRATVAGLGSQIAACIGVRPPSLASGGDVVAEADFNRPGYLINVSAGRGSDAILELSPK